MRAHLCAGAHASCQGGRPLATQRHPLQLGQHQHRHRLVPLLMVGASPRLLEGPVNVLRLSLHPEGLAPRIANLRQWREHLFERLRQQIHATGDEALAALLAELKGYPASFGNDAGTLPGEHHGVLMPFQFNTGHGVLNLVSTTTVFGSPVDITLQELALETFFPGDEASAELLRQLAAQA
ncbi:MAG: MmyB family transcriptional regulator [Hydrogenophaga sp.]|uniref:MmyB family transcriptional regulator n=1 Tax=Hydrogenophaga sp. TaxID=1904254 RepID=UPI004036314B